jgi:hypothetical protein
LLSTAIPGFFIVQEGRWKICFYGPRRNGSSTIDTSSKMIKLLRLRSIFPRLVRDSGHATVYAPLLSINQSFEKDVALQLWL